MANIPIYNDGQMMRVPEQAPLSRVQVAEYHADYAGLARVAAEAYEQPLMPKDMYEGDRIAAEAWGKSMRNLSKGMMDLGEAMVKVESTSAKAKDYADLQKGQEKIQEEAAAHDQFRLENLNPLAWARDLDKRVGNVVKWLAGAERSPRVQAHLQRGVRKMKDHGEVQHVFDLAGLNVRQAADANARRLQQAEKNGSIPDYEEAVHEAQELQLVTNKEAELLLKDGRRRLTRTQNRESLFAFIRKDPPVALAELSRDDSPILRDETPRGRAMARTFVRAESARHEYRTVQQIKEAYDADEEDGGDGLAAYEMDLRDETRGRMVGMMRGEWEMNDPVNLEEGYLAAARYNAKLDPSGEKLARLQTDLATKFSGPMEDEVQQALLAQAERTARHGLTALDMEFAELQGELAGGLHGGLFGEWLPPSAEVTGNGDAPFAHELARMQDLEAKGLAGQAVASIRGALQVGLSEGRYATPVAMRDEFRELMKPYISGAMERLLMTGGFRNEVPLPAYMA